MTDKVKLCCSFYAPYGQEYIVLSPEIQLSDTCINDFTAKYYPPDILLNQNSSGVISYSIDSYISTN